MYVAGGEGPPGGGQQGLGEGGGGMSQLLWRRLPQAAAPHTTARSRTSGPFSSSFGGGRPRLLLQLEPSFGSTLSPLARLPEALRAAFVTEPGPPAWPLLCGALALKLASLENALWPGTPPEVLRDILSAAPGSPACPPLLRGAAAAEPDSLQNALLGAPAAPMPALRAPRAAAAAGKLVRSKRATCTDAAPTLPLEPPLLSSAADGGA
eukprot:363747-Chlamydomonas_euryale.AAC.1